ncbi:ribosome maturation factor RimM [Buchnera aphidicola]|uniref:ribosome maturation factor RimM n=1 Tax=Buchnera aphidicola TaxID=9 RepID=UPI0030ECC62B
MKNFLIIGKLGSSHGILGWIKCFSYTEKKKNIFSYRPWYINKKKIYVNNWKKKKNFFFIKIKNINTRNKSDKLKNFFIYIKKKKLKKLKKNEYYWNEIINFKVLDKNYKKIGTVKSIIRNNNNDILVIVNKKINKKKEILIPFINNIFIKKIYKKNKIIIINKKNLL